MVRLRAGEPGQRRPSVASEDRNSGGVAGADCTAQAALVVRG
ncbi:hypothetical protein [Amycolatopsis japonica]